MRRQDKYRVILEANQKLEEKYLKDKGLIKEENKASLKDFALNKVKPYLEKEEYRVGLFRDISQIPREDMKKDKKLAALVMDGSESTLEVILSNDSPDPGNAARILGKNYEGDLMKNTKVKKAEEAEEGEIYQNSKGFGNSGSELALTFYVASKSSQEKW